MKKRKIKYADPKDPDMPQGELIEIPDFFPPPPAHVMPSPTVKARIALNKDSVEFFKKEAKKHHTKYQKMIRSLLDLYANQAVLKERKDR